MEIQYKELNKAIDERIQQTIREAETKAKSCAVRASNELRNSALFVLRGQRSGKRYRKPNTIRAHYTASAPGEPPAVRTGALRVSWGIKAEGDGKGNYTAGIYSDVPYAKGLDEGTNRIKPRPYKERIIERAKPRVISIFKEMETK